MISKFTNNIVTILIIVIFFCSSSKLRNIKIEVTRFFILIEILSNILVTTDNSRKIYLYKLW